MKKVANILICVLLFSVILVFTYSYISYSGRRYVSFDEEWLFYSLNVMPKEALQLSNMKISKSENEILIEFNKTSCMLVFNPYGRIGPLSCANNPNLTVFFGKNFDSIVIEEQNDKAKMPTFYFGVKPSFLDFFISDNRIIEMAKSTSPIIKTIFD